MVTVFNGDLHELHVVAVIADFTRARWLEIFLPEGAEMHYHIACIRSGLLGVQCFARNVVAVSQTSKCSG